MAYASKKKLSNNSVVPLGSNLFGTCSTVSGTQAKVVTMPDFNVLVEGVTIHVHFGEKNTASAPTLQVGSTEAKPIVGDWDSSGVYSFTYHNGSWMINDMQSGGGSGVYSYNDLSDKPSIEGVTLVGDKTFPELNLNVLTNTEIEDIFSNLI